MVCGVGGRRVMLVTLDGRFVLYWGFAWCLQSTFATANAILLAWFGITIAFCFTCLRMMMGKATRILAGHHEAVFAAMAGDEDTYVVVRSCHVKLTRILAGHRHQNGVCSHGEANDLLPELEEALYNIQFEQHWLQDENNRQPVVLQADNDRRNTLKVYHHNLLARDQGVVVAVEYDRRQFYGSPQNVELETTKFLHKLTQKSTVEPTKLPTILHMVNRCLLHVVLNRGCRLQNPRKICRTKKAPKATKGAENAKRETFSIPMELSTIAQLTKTSNNKILEAKGNAIQSNMNLKDLDYFNPKLQIGTDYRISNFICEATSNYQQTLKNKTSLRFGKYTTFDTIPAATFPNHYFEFISYNQLESKLPKPDENNNMHYPVLIDYIGCVRSVGDISINIIDTDYQLAATPATYYYLNPKILEAEGSRALITEHYCLNLVEKYKLADPAKVPPEVLAIEGKRCVFQFHFNTVGNMTDLTLDDIFDITNGNESTSTSSHKTIPGTMHMRRRTYLLNDVRLQQKT
ncbi:hypothetical protein Tco_1229409 [Tanacetum coccineum]